MLILKGLLRPRGGMLTRHHRVISSTILPSNPADLLLPLPLSKDELTTLEGLIGYRFHNPELLKEALIHVSYPNRPMSSLVHPTCYCHHSQLIHPHPKYRQSYKNLKIVGERAFARLLTWEFSSVIHFHIKRIVSVDIIVAANLTTQKLARTAIRLGLYHFLRRDSPKLDQEVEAFTKEVKGEVPYGGGVLKAPKVLADIVQSIFGAIYQDSSSWGRREYQLSDEMDRILLDYLDPIIYWDEMCDAFRWTLPELCQKLGLRLDYKNRIFQTCVRNSDTAQKIDINTTRVFINGKQFGHGSAETEFVAKHFAVNEALWNLPNP